jgi:hypothetical protein
MDQTDKEPDPFLLHGEEYSLSHREGFRAALDGMPNAATPKRSRAWLDGYVEGLEWAKNNQH